MVLIKEGFALYNETEDRYKGLFDWFQPLYRAYVYDSKEEARDILNGINANRIGKWKIVKIKMNFEVIE